MKNMIVLLLLILICFGCNKSKQENKIEITIDGVIDAVEWQNAERFTFEQSDILDVEVSLDFDNDNMYLAFVYGDYEDGTYLFPEFFIDTQFNKGEIWNSDDYWFHVSAQDCYSIGRRENYLNCNTHEWKARPNYPFGDNYIKIDEVEISVPLDFMNVSKGQNIGICFSVAIYPGDTERINYPNDAHEDIPDTWFEIIIPN